MTTHRLPASTVYAAGGGMLIFGLAVVSALLAGFSDGNVAVVVAPAVVVTGLWIICVIPVQTTVMFLMFVALAVDKPGDTDGKWVSPLGHVGLLLIDNLNKTIPIPALSVSLLQLLLILLAIIHVIRMFRTSRAVAGVPRPARPLVGAIAVSFLSVAAVCAYGIARGGDPQMCKIQLQVFIPLLLTAYLLASNLGPGEYKRLATVLVAAACVKALVAVWVRLALPFEFGTLPGQLQYATSHGDSMVFACAAAFLLALFFERPTRRHAWLALTIGAVLGAGLMANNRRLAWVQVALSVMVLLGLNPTGRASRGVVRAAIYALPLILLYVAVGWSSGSKIFAPVRMVRSIGDSNVDRSTLYRDTENYNLVYTLRRNPIMGTGFGHPFDIAAQLDDISHGFKEWRYLPHNSILGLWAFTGAIGFTGIWMVFAVALTLGARSYRFATQPQQRTAIACAITAILVYFIHCWGDIGYTEYRSIFLAGAALGIIGQMAVATGAWRPRLTQAAGARAR